MIRTIVAGVVAAGAIIAVTAPARATSTPQPALTGVREIAAPAAYSYGWRQLADGTYSTCNPRAVLYGAPYRARNNAWFETRQCATSSGPHQITITSNAVPHAGLVVAYESVQDGEFYQWRDRASLFPKPVDRMRRGPYAHVACTGRRIAGGWQCDIDAYFHPSRASSSRHASFELVVVNRRGAPGGQLASIGGVLYGWRSWMTCQRLASGACDPAVRPWRIFYAVRIHHRSRVTVPVGAFAHFAVRHGLLPASAWLGDVAYGAELWSGGKGLHISMTIRHGR